MNRLFELFIYGCINLCFTDIGVVKCEIINREKFFKCLFKAIIQNRAFGIFSLEVIFLCKNNRFKRKKEATFVGLRYYFNLLNWSGPIAFFVLKMTGFRIGSSRFTPRHGTPKQT